jgi:hypothetical protein
MAVPYTFGTATASIPLSNLDSNFATTITLGNTAIQLGNTVTTLNNMTLANVTISGGTSNTTSNSISNGTSNVSIATSGGAVTVATNGNTAVTVDTSQNVGVGTASQIRSGKLSVSGIISTNNNINWGPAGNGRIFSDVNWGCILQADRASPASAEFLLQNAGGTSRMLIDTSGNLQFNSGYGSAATAYGCRAWINFNGGGTPAIRGSGNVSSLTDNGTGDYTINFTTAMPDVNYSLAGAAGQNTTSMHVVMQPINLAPPGTTGVRIQTPSADGVLIADPTLVCVNVFR